MPADLVRDGAVALAGRADWLRVVHLVILELCSGRDGPTELRVVQRRVRRPEGHFDKWEMVKLWRVDHGENYSRAGL